MLSKKQYACSGVDFAVKLHLLYYECVQILHRKLTLICHSQQNIYDKTADLFLWKDGFETLAYAWITSYGLFLFKSFSQASLYLSCLSVAPKNLSRTQTRPVCPVPPFWCQPMLNKMWRMHWQVFLTLRLPCFTTRTVSLSSQGWKDFRHHH